MGLLYWQKADATRPGCINILVWLGSDAVCGSSRALHGVAPRKLTRNATADPGTGRLPGRCFIGEDLTAL